MRRARLGRGLLQKESANGIGVSPETIIHWERNRTTPPARMIPRITLFLGYCPWTVPQTPGDRFQRVRVGLGLSQKGCRPAPRRRPDDRDAVGAGRAAAASRMPSATHRALVREPALTWLVAQLRKGG